MDRAGWLHFDAPSPDGYNMVFRAMRAITGWKHRWTPFLSIEAGSLKKRKGEPEMKQKLWILAAGLIMVSGVLIFSPLKLNAHRVQVTHIAGLVWSPDASQIIGVSADGNTLQTWDVATGQPLLTFGEHPGGLTALVWSPDGLRLATGAADYKVRVWDTMSGELLATLEGHADQINGLDWSSDGAWIVSSGFTSYYLVWDATTYHLINTIAGDSYDIAFSPDGGRLAVAGVSGVKIVDVATGGRLVFFQEHAGPVITAEWSPDGSKIISSGLDYTLRVWDAATGLALHVFENITYASDQGLLISHDGNQITIARTDGTIQQLDVATGQTLTTANLNQPISIAAWSPYGGRLAVGSTEMASAAVPGQTDRVAQTLENTGVQIVVPLASPEQLQTIATRCNAPPDLMQTFSMSGAPEEVSSFVMQVETLTAGQIAPGCAAELVAVAQALQADQ